MAAETVTAGETLYRLPGEIDRYRVEFRRRLAEGDTLTSVHSLTVDPAGPVLGTPEVVGTGVEFGIDLTGVPAGTYHILLFVNTIGGARPGACCPLVVAEC